MVNAYFELCKPRVVLLMLVTAYVGMQLASPSIVPFLITFWALLGIALMASAAAVINHVVDQHIDSVMARTHLRPLPTKKISTQKALVFSGLLGTIGFFILYIKINSLTALLTFSALIGYAVVYTIYLKRATPQNIVWGGLAGAMPPLLGWTAVTGSMSWKAFILVLIIFIWTPPHFWALAIYRYSEYEKIKSIPMLPVTHGIPLTKRYILIYSVLLWPVSSLPFWAKMSGPFYLIFQSLLSFIFIYYAVRLKKSKHSRAGRVLFQYSITYLFLLFVVLFIDHFLYPYHPSGLN